MHTVYLASVFLHIVAAMTYVGGMIFLVAVAVPALRKDRVALRSMMQTLGMRFRTVSWTALVTLVITGVYNILHRGYSFGDIFSGEVFAGQWGKILAHKLSLVGAILVLGVVHDFYVGPRASRGEESAQESARKTASIMGRVTFACALAVVALAVALVRG